MGAFDTHTHLQFPQFEADRAAVLEACFAAGLEGLAVVGTDISSALAAIDLCAGDSRLCATGGVHPHDASGYDNEAEEALAELAASGRIVAIGEIGLDFFRNLSPADAQMYAFQRQLDLANRCELPVVVHTRDSIDEAYRVLRAWVERRSDRDSLAGVMHCFSGTVEQALAFVEIGFMVSIPATITYPKNEGQRAVARALPLDWLVVETDSPHLPPQHMRGKRNDPTQVLDVIKEIAKARGQTPDEVVEATTNNAKRLFRL